MKKLCLTLVFAAMLQAGFSQTKNFIDQPYLETSAEVDTLVTPDRIYLRIRLQESDTKGRTSLESLERQLGQTLEKLGVDLEEQLTVSDLGSEFQKYFLRKQDILKEKDFELVLYDAGTTGRVLYELEKVGISNIQLLKTEYEGMEALKDLLRVKAVLKAKNQGALMADALGQSLGPALHIMDRVSVVYKRSALQETVIMSADQAEDSYVPLPSEFDQIPVQLGVQVKFKLE
jgi:uncharacterized protein YggE